MQAFDGHAAALHVMCRLRHTRGTKAIASPPLHCTPPSQPPPTKKKHGTELSARMLYHALRLACIIVSSFKTWKAVVDSGDRSLARRYMFLWFLTLSGLSLEPIADSVLGPRIPIYEGLKIIIAGWLLLAHFYLTNPVNDPDTYQTWHIEQHPTRGQVVYDRGAPQSKQFYLPETQKAPEITHSDFRPEERGTASTAVNLDFGRFKRDLERRRTANSVHSTTDYGLHNVLSSSKALPDPSDLYTIASTSALNRPANTGEAFSVDRKSPTASGHYEFGAGNASRKRPFSAASFDPQSTRPISRQGSRRRNLDHEARPGVEPAEADSSTPRMTKRLRNLLEGERPDEAPHDGTGTQSRGTALERTKDEVVRRSESSLPLRFSRPRPPGRNLKEVLPHSSVSVAGPSAPLRRQDSQESRKRSLPTPDIHSPKPKTEVTSASFESRMKNVRDWLKERNPSMISPPLSTKSEFLNPSTRADNGRIVALVHKDFTGEIDAQGFQKPPKRKAQRQIAPPTGPKRLAHEGRLNRSRSDEGARIYPEPNDTRSQVPLRRTESFRHSRPDQNHGNGPYDDVQGYIDPQRDQPTADPFFPPTNWSKSQKRNSVTPKNSVPTSMAAVAAPSSPFTFRITPNKSANPLITNSFVGDDENIAISPLIKLRQSQLKRRQQEDFLGVRRDDSPAAVRRAEEEGGLAFNQTLEAWEKDDDEALARDAAREAAEAKVKGMKLGRELGGSTSSLSSEEGGAAVSSARKNTTVVPASSSLLRAVEFNGDPPRRPEPDLRRKKQVLEVAAQPKTTNDSAPAATIFSSSSKQRPASIQSLSSSFGKGDNRFKPNVFRPTRSGSQTREREDSASRRQMHPGLYTPSKKNPTSDSASLLDDPAPPQSPHRSTPTAMSRYIQLSTLSDEET